MGKGGKEGQGRRGEDLWGKVRARDTYAEWSA